MRLLLIIIFLSFIHSDTAAQFDGSIRILMTKKEKKKWENYCHPLFFPFNKKDNGVEFVFESDSVKMIHKNFYKFNFIDSLLSYPISFEIKSKDSISLDASTKWTNDPSISINTSILFRFYYENEDLYLKIYNGHVIRKIQFYREKEFYRIKKVILEDEPVPQIEDMLSN